MPQPPLDRPGIVPLVGERIAAGVAKHVRVSLRFEAETSAGRTLHHPGKARGREWRAALTDEDERRRLALTLQPAKRTQLIALKGMGALGPALDPQDVQDGTVEGHLVPTQVADLGRPQPVAE